jgi:polyphosphate kinase 2
MLHDVRDYIDRLKIDGHTIGEDYDDDPVLIDPQGRAVDTWREDYPYQERMPREEYEAQKYALQVELLKLQNHQIETGARHVLLFEGRDAAGKGGTIKRFTEHLNPRYSRVVALTKPGEREQHQWYFQRYVQHLPTAGEMVLFDRSWYNRAGVERVMGFATDTEYSQFMNQVPLFESMLVDSGISLTKFWFSVTPAEQRTRFIIRQVDPVRRWKLSPMDLQSLDKWEVYTAAKEEMFRRTDTDHAPWTTVKSNDKKRARISAMQHFLSQFDYEGKDPGVVGAPDPLIVERGLDAVLS